MKAVLFASILAILFVASFADEEVLRPPKIPVLACSLCQNVMSKVESAAGQNLTVAALTTKVTAICSKYSIQDWCAKNVIPQLPTVLSYIQKKASPDKVCQAVKLCKNSSMEEESDMEEKRDAEFKRKNPFHGLGINCAVCQNVVNYLENVITSNETLAKLTTDLTTACTKLGVNTWCQKNLLPQLPSIFYKLKTKASPSSICKATKLCRNETRPPKPPKGPKPPKAASPTSLRIDELPNSEKFSVACEACQAVITYTKNYVGSNNTQAAITAALQKACSALPFAQDLCQQVILPYVQQIVQGFIAQQDPLQICQKIKICKADAPPNPAAEAVVIAAVEAEEKRSAEGAVKCEVCTAVLTYVKTFIGSNTSQAAIEKALDKACSKIPFAKDLCTTVLEPYVTQIINGFIAKQDPAQICQKIKLCTAPSVAVDIVYELEAEKREVEDIEGPVQCALCTSVITYVKSFIGSNTSQAAIKKALDQACTKIPFGKNFCAAVLEPYVTQIINGIVAKEDPAAICQKIKLCAAPSATEVFEVAAEKRDNEDTELDLRCGLCVAVLEYVKGQIQGDKTQAAIQNALNAACSKIPFAKSICSAVIQPFVTQIVQGFVANQDPSTICNVKLHLCN